MKSLLLRIILYLMGIVFLGHEYCSCCEFRCLSDPVPTQGIEGKMKVGMSGRMGGGMERDCNVVYGLLYIALCHQGMKEGWDEERRAIWEGACRVDRT